MKEKEVDVTAVTRETYNQIALGYAQRIEDLVSNTWVGKFEESSLDKLVTLVRPKERQTIKVLDVGCGYGKDTFYLSQKEGVVATGLDYSSGMLSEAQKIFPTISFVQMDMRNLVFPDAHFDAVWANGCVYHVPKKELTRVLQEVRRVLKPSGIFSFNFKVGTGEQLEKNPRSYSGKPRFYAYYAIEEMKDLVAQADFKVIEAQSYPQEIFEEQVVQMWAVKP